MGETMKPSYRPKLALALLLLLALAGLLPDASRAGASAAPRSIVTAAAGSEIEPNNTYQTATFIQLDPVAGTSNMLQKTMLGTIDSQLIGDNGGRNGDWYRFVALKGGASVSI